MCTIRYAGLALTASAAIALGILPTQSALARPTGQSAAFNYQGVLKNGGTAVNASVDLQFKLFDAAVAGNVVGAPIILAPVVVSSGLFSALLDFGALAFDGNERWLEVAVCSPPNNGNGPFTTLTPRQKVAATPYAAYALNALLPASYATAVNFSNVGNAFTGSGAGLTALNAANLSTGTIATGRLSGSYNIGISGNAATATAATTAGNVTGTVAVANGGTGATSASSALANLGAAPFTHIHSLSGMIGTLVNTQLPVGGNWLLSSNLTLDSDTLVIDQANDRVGIGLTTPATDLEVRGSGSLGEVRVTPFSANGNSQVVLAENTGATGATILRHEGTLNQFQILGVNSTENGPWLTIGRDSGLVGIGTTIPLAKVHVQEGSAGTISPAASASLVLERSGNNYLHMYAPDDKENGILFGGDTTDIGGGIIFNTASFPNSFEFRAGGNVTSMRVEPGGYLELVGAFTNFRQRGGAGNGMSALFNGSDYLIANFSAGDITLGTGPNINSTGNTLVVSSSRRVGVMRSPSSNDFEVEGTASKSSAGNWLANSDARIKTDVTTVSSALDTLDRVRLVSFRYTPEYRKAHSTIEDRRYLNVIAQEFAQVFPEHVKGSGEYLPDGSEILQVDTYPLTIYSAAAVQELHAQVRALEEQSQQKETEIAALREQVEDLRMAVQQLVSSKEHQ